MMETYERRKLADCAYNITDKAQAILEELNRMKPHKSYILEKAKPILNDIQVIINYYEK